MGATITQGANVIAPDLILALSDARPSGSIIHRILGGGVTVSLTAAGLRTGTIEMFFLTEAASEAAKVIHASPGVFTLTYPERVTLEMLYVLGDGDITRRQAEQGLSRWIVTVPFQEVTA